MPTLPALFTLAGRVAIVTGGSRGLGLEMAEGLAEAGAALMLCARREEWLTPAVADLRERGFKVEGMTCDVANPAEVQAVVDQTIAVYGRLDILVNNAGITWAAPPEDMPVERWLKVIDTNLTGAFLFSQAAARQMLKVQYGRIINVASIAGLNGVSNFAGYVGTKHAVRGISHSLYMELRDFGIKVSTVYPGSIQTNFFDAIPGMDAHEHMMQPEDVALTIVQTLETHPNYFVVDVECRPLRPKGKK